MLANRIMRLMMNPILLRLESAGLSSMDIWIDMKKKTNFPLTIVVILMVDLVLFAATDLLFAIFCSVFGAVFHWWYGPVFVTGVSLLTILYMFL